MGIAHLKAEQWPSFMKHAASAGLAAKPRKKRVVQQLYDSCEQHFTAGIRSLGMYVRHMLYRADPYQIDLQVESQPDRNRLIVTGQLIDLRPDVDSAGVQVTLSDGRENIVRTLTNQFGEFRSEVSVSGDLELTFLAGDEKPIVILLRGTLDPTPRAKN